MAPRRGQHSVSPKPQAVRISALTQIKGCAGWWGLTPAWPAQWTFHMKHTSPSWAAALDLAQPPSGSVGPPTPIATNPTSTHSGDWGPPGRALPPQAVPLPLGKEA